MKTAVIYCRVSTDNQEQEGTSLQTQLEACRNYCQDKGYDVAYSYSEAYSGLTLDRPHLNELRELVRNEQIDVMVVYCLDRLSRDPTHGVILTQELDRHDVKLEAVTEDVDNSELGKLISYIRGFASKLEAEKIRERTDRGKRAKAKQGQLVGGGHTIYGYDYVKVGNDCGGRRVINEAEAEQVRNIFTWLVDEGITISAIVQRLNAAGITAKQGRNWARSSINGILKNPAYTGKTYAFTTTQGKMPYSKPREEWLEVPEATPAIIDKEVFEAAQKQLDKNRIEATRNLKRFYLLREHVFCEHCGKAYGGWTITKDRYGHREERRRYRCSNNRRMGPCSNKSWSADKLEKIVWDQVEKILTNPELIVHEVEKQRQSCDRLEPLVNEKKQAEKQLKALQREQEQLLQWALKGFPEETVVAENKRINSKRETLQEGLESLEKQIEASRNAQINMKKLTQFVDIVRNNLNRSDNETKRLALDALSLKLWIDGGKLEITGSIPMEEGAIVNECLLPPDTTRPAAAVHP